MMHHSPVLRTIGLLAWIITAVAAIAWGLEAANYNIWTMGFIQKYPDFIPYIKYGIAFFGLVSLVMFFEMLTHKHNGSCCKC